VIEWPLPRGLTERPHRPTSQGCSSAPATPGSSGARRPRPLGCAQQPRPSMNTG
jgi:hypothetical protein